MVYVAQKDKVKVIIITIIDTTKMEMVKRRVEKVSDDLFVEYDEDDHIAGIERGASEKKSAA